MMRDNDRSAPNDEALNEEDLIAIGEANPNDDPEPTTDWMTSVDEAIPYEPPVDPPVVPGGRDGIEVAQGFAESSDGEFDLAVAPGDDEITEMVQRLLRTDSATSSLDLRARTVDGVVYLRGLVASVEDSDLAVEVASRVPGVVDVVDQTIQGP